MSTAGSGSSNLAPSATTFGWAMMSRWVIDRWLVTYQRQVEAVMIILGIDIGGSGIKGAPVDGERGELTAEYYRIPTPQPSTPDAVGDVVAELARHFNWHGPIGCTFPAVIQDGVAYSA